MGVPSLVRRVTGVSPGMKIVHGQSTTGLLASVRFDTILLCEIIKEKSGSEKIKAILRLLAEVDKVVNMDATFFCFYNGSVNRGRKIKNKISFRM
jgi:hypothetical protein